MVNLKNVKIGVRLSVGFGVVISLLAVVIIKAVMLLNSSNAASDNIVAAEINAALVEDWRNHVLLNGVRTVGRIFSNSPTYEKQLVDDMNRTMQEVNIIQEKLTKLTVEPEAKKLMESVAAKRKQIIAIREQIFKAKANGESAVVQEIFDSKFKPTLLSYEESMLEVSKYYQDIVAKTSQSMDDEFQKALYTLIGLGIIASIIGIGFAIGIMRSITKPLYEAVRVADAIASGNLTAQHITNHSKDETGQLLASLEKMRENISGIVGGIRSGVISIVAQTQEIAEESSNLSARTEAQASALQQTAATMEELASTVQQNANNTNLTDKQMVQVSKMAEQGKGSVEKVVGSMGEINASSRQIVDIISIIDGIAFQTNILALNAAVEAARAGEQGRGFAVVATEVRNLAHRSAAAAKDIKTLIDDSVAKVGMGIVQANAAGEDMNKIAAEISNVQNMMGGISDATREQEIAIDAVKLAVNSMDDGTQQNAALVEQTAAAAEALRSEAEILAKLVSQFKDVEQVAAPKKSQLQYKPTRLQPVLIK